MASAIGFRKAAALCSSLLIGALNIFLFFVCLSILLSNDVCSQFGLCCMSLVGLWLLLCNTFVNSVFLFGNLSKSPRSLLALSTSASSSPVVKSLYAVAHCAFSLFLSFFLIFNSNQRCSNQNNIEQGGFQNTFAVFIVLILLLSSIRIVFALIFNIIKILQKKKQRQQQQRTQVHVPPIQIPQATTTAQQQPATKLDTDKQEQSSASSSSSPISSPCRPIVFTIPEKFASKQIILQIKSTAPTSSSLPSSASSSSLSSKPNEQTPLSSSSSSSSSSMRRVYTWSNFENQNKTLLSSSSSTSLSASSSSENLNAIYNSPKQQEKEEQPSSSCSPSCSSCSRFVLPGYSLVSGCCICLEEFQPQQKASVLPCFHSFHSACLLSWLEKKTTCPLCRASITPAVPSCSLSSPSSSSTMSSSSSASSNSLNARAYSSYTRQQEHYEQIRRNLRAAQLL